MKRTFAVLAMLACAPAVSAQLNPSKAGTIIQPSDDVSVFSTVRDKLAGAADIRVFLVLPNRDCVVVYDTVRDKPDTADFMDNNPHIAIFHGGDAVLDIESGALPGRFGLAGWL
jgi:hypothetical protein